MTFGGLSGHHRVQETSFPPHEGQDVASQAEWPGCCSSSRNTSAEGGAARVPYPAEYRDTIARALAALA